MRLGTRGSALALKQADIVSSLLSKQGIDIQQVIINSSGDQSRAPISQIGGRGIFIKELEQALLEGTIDFAVHSFKDMTSKMPSELVISAVLSPEAVHDVLVSRTGQVLNELPESAVIGTGSMRRKCLLKQRRPDLRIKEIRGNVPTRLAQLDSGAYDAIVLSAVGLLRLGLSERIAESFDAHEFTIAPGQGVIAIQSRKKDEASFQILSKITDTVQSELSAWDSWVMQELGFDCSIPLGFSMSKVSKEQFRHSLFVGDLEGGKHFFDDRVSLKQDLAAMISNQVHDGKQAYESF